MNDNEQKIFAALSDGRWDWRTLDGLKRSTGLDVDTILKTIIENRSKIDFQSSPRRDNVLFRLKGHHATNRNLLDEALDVMALGAR
jgi:hypothetical protein